MGILSGTGILDGNGILTGRGILFQSGILVPPSLDPDAAAYIAAVTAAGATVTGAQRTAIDTFYLAAKAGGYYTSLKRLYLPIWGVAAANAIDMIGLTSGTFNGGVTHGAGFVQGNGTTGNFSLGVAPSGLGITTASGSLFALVKQESALVGDRSFIGAMNSVATGIGQVQIYENVTVCLAAVTRSVGGGLVNGGVTISNPVGVLVVNRNSATVIKIHKRTTSGFVSLTGSTFSTADVTTSLITAMAVGTLGATNHFSDAQLGVYGAGIKLTDDTTVSNFTLALKTLWETATGLTLP